MDRRAPAPHTHADAARTAAARPEPGPGPCSSPCSRRHVSGGRGTERSPARRTCHEPAEQTTVQRSAVNEAIGAIATPAGHAGLVEEFDPHDPTITADDLYPVMDDCGLSARSLTIPSTRSGAEHWRPGSTVSPHAGGSHECARSSTS